MDQVQAVIREKVLRFYQSAFHVDPTIKPKCVFWDEDRNHDKASILAEIIDTAIEIV
jgi:hypothetical protein